MAAWNIRRDPFGKEKQIETFILNNDIDVIFLLETDVKHFTKTFLQVSYLSYWSQWMTIRKSELYHWLDPQYIKISRYAQTLHYLIVQ